MSDDEDNYDYDDYEETDFKNIGKAHFEGLTFDTFISKGRQSELSFEEKFEYILERNVSLLDFDEGKKLIPYVMKSIKDIPYIMFKNPLAFLFGYYVIDKDKINTDRLEECVELCKKTLNAVGIKKDEKEDKKVVVDKKYSHIKHITKPDIIRYGRLIIQTSSKQ